MRFPRSSGVLLPVFSLPGEFGIGDLGPEARHFVDFLQAAGQTIWQLLPLGPSTRGDSPYSSYSAFAGNPLLVSLLDLVDAGLLTKQQAIGSAAPQEDAGRVNYQHVRSTKLPLLRSSFTVFQADADQHQRHEFSTFCENNAGWLEDFAVFDAAAAHFADADWSRWASKLVRRDPTALEALKEELAEQILFARFQQFIFAGQWQRLKKYANDHNVRIYGDMPIFVAFESVDVWTNQDLFCLDDLGHPLIVAGVPPDYFSATGQMWGNPLYRWDRIAAANYDWWTRRFRQALEYFDILRIDHFRGFESYWEIPAGAENAIGGRWVQGPRDTPFQAAREALGELPIVAEDLGLITDDVHALREQLGFPGMRVLQFGCDHEHDPYHRPDCYPEHSVAYTGTHDNDTVMGWYQKRVAEGTDHILRRFLSGDPEQVATDLMRAVLNSASDTAILPMQDVLGLGSEARINTPGEPDGNWTWRCPAEALSADRAASLRSLTEAAGR